MASGNDSDRRIKRSKGEMPDLNRILREMMEALVRMRRDIAFRQRLRQSIPEVEVDKVHLAQFLHNLFGNVAKAMPDGGKIAMEPQWRVPGILIHLNIKPLISLPFSHQSTTDLCPILMKSLKH